MYTIIYKDQFFFYNFSDVGIYSFIIDMIKVFSELTIAQTISSASPKNFLDFLWASYFEYFCSAVFVEFARREDPTSPV